MTKYNLTEIEVQLLIDFGFTQNAKNGHIDLQEQKEFISKVAESTLPDVKDWDAVNNGFVDHCRSNKLAGSYADLITYLKQHYSAPVSASEQKPLKELSDISDEDAILFINTFDIGNSGWSDSYKIDWTKKFFSEHPNTLGTFLKSWNDIVRFFEFWNKLGYKLPVYFSPQPNKVSPSDEEISASLHSIIFQFENEPTMKMEYLIKQLRTLFNQPNKVSVSDAIEFAEWVARELWIVSSNDLWYQKSDGNPDEGLTTTELYTLFKESKH